MAGLALAGLMGCSGSEPPPPSAPPTTLPVTRELPAQTPPISGDAPVVIPEDVRGKWAAVRLVVEDKEGETQKEYTLKIGVEFPLPDSNLILKVDNFLPDLKIKDNTFTSASNELLNPSAHLVVTQEGREIFNGWLFQLFPTVHPFNHDRYRITLKDSVAAGTFSRPAESK
ncbi:MAG TPA: DUF2155 domain-containing protein [Nitrospiria bacterium]|nr:DUF2155 domain-containing protein [Nitrospiria bacterium]